MTDRRRYVPTRRDTLKILGVGMAGLAGCSGDGDGGDGTSGDGGDTATEPEGTTTGDAGDDLEDRMTIYTTTEYDLVIQHFEEEYGVTVDESVYSGPQTTTRFRTEAEAGDHNASAIIGSADGLAWESVRRHLTEVEISEENRDRVLNEAREEQLAAQDAVGISWPILSILRSTPYNTNAVDEPPIEWEEFTESEWEDRMINPAYNMRRIYMVLRLDGWEEDEIQDYMVALDENMDSYPDSAPANVQQIIGGQADVGVQILSHFLGGPMNDGAPIDVAYPPFTSEHYNAVGVAEEAPSPNLAREFADWITGEAGQEAIQQEMGLNPIDENLEHGNATLQDRIDEYDPTIYPLIPTEEEVNETTEILNDLLSVNVG